MRPLAITNKTPGALVYHLRNALRARSNEESTRILARVRAACAPDSKVLISEAPLLPSPAPRPYPSAAEKNRNRYASSALDTATADLWLLSFGDRVRSERDFAALAARAGLRVSVVFGNEVGGGAGAGAGAAVIEMVPV